jgi:predicted MPP superfamily phosphohydrolase
MRRHWLRNFLIVLFAVAAALALDAAWLEPASIRVSPYDITVPQRLKGLRIAVISDLHAGSPYIDAAKIDRIVAMTNAAHPDLVLMPGDFVINRMPLGRRMAIEDIVAHLKLLHARLGVYAVLGNHDHLADAAHIAATFRAAGIPVMENVHVTLPGTAITLVGIGDFFSTASNTPLALEGVAADAQAICFTHTPDAFAWFPPTCALTIAGHTHGGQVMLPFFGRPAVNLASRFGQRYAIGLVHEDGKLLFVSPGIGTSQLPVRFGVPPEISLLTLK